VPRVIGQDSETKSFVLEFLGPEFRNWKAQLLAGDIDAQTASDVGDMLGRIHAATADRPDIATRFATDDTFYAIRLEPYLVECSRRHPELAERLMMLVTRTAQTRRVLVHGDLSPKNILAGPHGPVLIDAECAWFGDPAFDLAFCLNHFLLKCVARPQWAPGYLACYRAFAHAYLGGVTWELRDAIEVRIASLLPALLLARIDGKSPVEYMTAERDRQIVRNAACPLVAHAPARLEEIAVRWSAALGSQPPAH